MTVAHELDHALEDQRFGLDVARLARGAATPRSRTRRSSRASATELMLRYAAARFDPEEALGGTLASALRRHRHRRPAAVPRRAARVPVHRRPGVRRRPARRSAWRWTLVDLALRARPPVSTEQILHPDLYLRVEQPDRVSLRRCGRGARAGWRRLDRSSLGEWLTGECSRGRRRDVGGRRRGLGRRRYALYGRGGDRLLVARWRWDTPRDAKQFLVALRAWADDGLAGARRVDTAAWRTDTGAAALAAAGDSVALVLAPDVPVAARD